MQTQDNTYNFILALLQELSKSQLQEVQHFLEGLNAPTQKRKKPSFGCMQGSVAYIADDFDDPLEDFKDYME